MGRRGALRGEEGMSLRLIMQREKDRAGGDMKRRGEVRDLLKRKRAWMGGRRGRTGDRGRYTRRRGEVIKTSSCKRER